MPARRTACRPRRALAGRRRAAALWPEVKHSLFARTESFVRNAVDCVPMSSILASTVFKTVKMAKIGSQQTMCPERLTLIDVRMHLRTLSASRGNEGGRIGSLIRGAQIARTAATKMRSRRFVRDRQNAPRERRNAARYGIKKLATPSAGIPSPALIHFAERHESLIALTDRCRAAGHPSSARSLFP